MGGSRCGASGCCFQELLFVVLVKRANEASSYSLLLLSVTSATEDRGNTCTVYDGILWYCTAIGLNHFLEGRICERKYNFTLFV